jgi:poly(A) polymerase
VVSRRRDEPCVVRHLVGVGKLLPKVVENSELMDIINRLEPELTDLQQSQRETVLAVVKQACTECLGFPASLHLFGSARLGVANPDSDLDAICLIPDYLSGKRFLVQVEAILAGLCQRSQVMLDVKFPVLRLQMEGISLDLLYTQVEGFSGGEDIDLQALKPQIKNTKFIIACWDADLIIDLVKQHGSQDGLVNQRLKSLLVMQSQPTRTKISSNIDLSVGEACALRLPDWQESLADFRLLLRAVRGWAKSRGLYGNSWGFLGGFSWSLLCAYCYINYRSKDKSLERLLANFFQILSQHNWKQPIALTDLGNQYTPKLPQDLLPIVSSIAPCKNTARNVTRSTAKILQDEFTRGAKTIDRILANREQWISLYEPINLSIESDLLLTITLTHPDENELRNSTNTLEACIVGLIIELEQIDIFVRPQPQIDRSETTSKFRLFLNLLSNCESTRVEQIVNNFILGGSGAFSLAIASPWRIELMDLTIAQLSR